MALSRKPQEIVEDSKNPLLGKHESWGRVQVGEIAEILNGYAFKSSKFTNDKGTPLIRIRDVGKDSSNTFYDGGYDETYLVNDGDLLVGMDGDFRCSIWKGGKALLNQRVCKISLKTEEYDFRFLSYVLQPYLDAIHAETSAVTVKHLSSRSISDIPLPLPPKEQQKRIVAKIEELFSHIDAGIEALKKAKQLLKQYRQSVLKAAVTGELTKEWREANKDKLEPASQLLEHINAERVQEPGRKLEEWEQELAQWKSAGEKGKKPAKPKKTKELESMLEAELNSLGDLPDGWLWERLGNLTVDVFDGPFGSNLKSSDYVEEGIRVIRLENIGNLEFKDNKQSFVKPEKYEQLKKHTVGCGDLIFSSFVADGTRVVVLPKHIEKAINKADCFCVRCYGGSVYNKYLALFLATNSAYKRLENEVHGATRPRINTTQLKNIEIPICSIEEQNEAVRILELKSDAITRLEGEIDEKLLMVDKNKQSVLATAFSGQL